MSVINIVDDDAAVRDALTYLLLGEGLAAQAYASAEEFLAAWPEARDGVIVLDIRMTGISGIELFDELRKTPPVPPVIFLTGHGDVPLAVEAMRAGAFDFHEKPFDETRFISAVRRALMSWRTEQPRLIGRATLVERLKTLSPREKQVMELMIAGMANKQIAFSLEVTIRTVEVHRANVLRKLGYRSVVDLIRGVA